LDIDHGARLARIALMLVILTGRIAVADDAEPVAEMPRLSAPKNTDSWFNLRSLDINVYGLSYHPDRQAVHEQNLDNQINPGLALHYELSGSERGSTFLEAGAYKDSGSNWAKFAGLGYQFKFGNWRIGGAVAAVNSATYNRGTTFVGMIPLVTYDLGRIKVNATYFPKIANYNEVDAFGFYLSIPLGAWMN
jgi:hypothetical protein